MRYVPRSESLASGRGDDRVLLFDALRVVAIGMVLLSHVLITMGPPWSEVGQPYLGVEGFYRATWGQLGVTLFLVVSGLCLEFASHGRRTRPVRFFLGRVVRIYPVYYMSLLIGLAVQSAVAVWSVVAHGRAFVLLPDLSIGDLVLMLTGFSAFAGQWGGPLVWSSWFIGLIMVLYLVFPVLSAAIGRAPWTSLAGLLIVSATSRLLTGGTETLPGHPLEWFPVNRMFEFGAGIFLVRVLGRERLLRWNPLLSRIPFLTFFSVLSFPLFLVHDPLRRVIYLGPPEAWYSLPAGIPVFIGLSLSLSALVLVINERLSTFLAAKIRFRVYSPL